MRFLVIAFAVIAAAGASTLTADYLPPVVDNSLPGHEYLAPAVEAHDDQSALADGGYRPKFRNRRDVSELLANEYIPPATNYEESVIAEAVEPAINEFPKNEYIPSAKEALQTANANSAKPAQEGETHLADDGYRYKVVRRLKYRKRRDVNELPQTEYLAPVASNYVPQNEYLPPVEEAQQTANVNSAEPAPGSETQLSDDGYRYKVVRRLKYRKRRDVNALPQTEYLAPVASNNVPQNEYLPPVEEAQQTANVNPAEPAPGGETQLSADGYRYKVVRRLKYRKRRDVNELPQTEYLAPVASNNVPQNEYLPPVEEAQQTANVNPAEPAPGGETQLSADGYRYKVVRRLKYRKRRDVNELPQTEYLAPVASNNVPQNEYLPPVEEAQQTANVNSAEAVPGSETQLSDDGYRYKVVRRLKYRKRRDVSELPQTEYLAPIASNNLPQNEYIPPAEEAQQKDNANSAQAAPGGETQLSDDGYRYKVVRRLKYRKRRGVNELPQTEYLAPVASNNLPQNEYLPPVEEAPAKSNAKSAEPAPGAETQLSDDGYRYKLVRRLKYRKRRDVNELPQNEYLPPADGAQESAVSVEVTAPVTEDADTILTNDGYRYKVVRRLKYRHRRDVNELPVNEYLPPAGEGQEGAEQQPEVETAALTNDGYQYKIVRRLKYRRH